MPDIPAEPKTEPKKGSRALCLRLTLWSAGCFLFALVNLTLPSFGVVPLMMYLGFLAIPAGMLLLLLAPVAFIIDLVRLWNPGQVTRPSVRSLWQGCGLWLLMAVGIQYVFMANFKEAMIHSNKTRVGGDMRTMSIALETYYLDHYAYPAWSLRKGENAFGGLPDKKGILDNMPTLRLANGSALATLTTPVVYLTGFFTDPFSPVKDATFCYWTRNVKNTTETGYILWSPGPDGVYDLTMQNIAKAYDPAAHVPSPYLVCLTYDPSNGTASRGDVYRYKQ